VEAAEQNRKELEQSIEANRVWNIKEDKTKSKGKYYSSNNNNNNKVLNNKDQNKNIKYKVNEPQKIEKSGKNLTVRDVVQLNVLPLCYIDKNKQSKIK